MSETRVFNLLIALASGVVVYVIVVGGVVCIFDDEYSFNSYLTDIAQVVPYIFGAIIAVVLKSRVLRDNTQKTPETLENPPVTRRRTR